jgi:hypothetical protein
VILITGQVHLSVILVIGLVIHSFYLLSFGLASCKSVHFLLTEKIKRGKQENRIIFLFNIEYNCLLINAIILQDKHKFNAVS